MIGRASRQNQGAGLRGSVQLSLATLAICVMWLVVLPWTARQPHVRQRIDFLDERGIDPSAMFYTELKAMDAILSDLESGNDSNQP